MGKLERTSAASEPRERSGDRGVPASERVGGSGGAKPPGRMMRVLCAVAALTITAAAPLAQVGKSQGVMDINTMSESDIGVLPNLTPAIAKTLVAKRPFLSITELHTFLLAQGLTADQAAAVYPKAFVHINLNTATAEEIILVPGAGRRMVREFPEYRPWKTWAQFEREIGKYLGRGEVGAENARKLAQYTFIPMNANTVSDADLMTVPGATQAWVAKLKAGRPYKGAADLEKAVGKANARFFVIE
jgi:DNA uptake protein ComE-like DNA-binding protein